MGSRDDIEAFMRRSGVSFEEVEDEMWVVHDVGTSENIIVRIAAPLVIFRMKVLSLDAVSDEPGLFKQLLSLNATDMVHGAYAATEDAVVLTCSLRMENIDYNEFQGAIDDFSLAITNHYQLLAKYRKAA